MERRCLKVGGGEVAVDICFGCMGSLKFRFCLCGWV